MATVAAYGSRKPATANNAFAWQRLPKRRSLLPRHGLCRFGPGAKCRPSECTAGKFPQVGRSMRMASDRGTALAKTLLPAAGARGYGLAFLSSILAGPLVGSKMPLHKGNDPESAGSEHFFYCIDLTQFCEPDKYYAESTGRLPIFRPCHTAGSIE